MEEVDTTRKNEMRLDVVPDDLLSQDVPFDEVSILPDCPTTTYVLFP